MSRLLSLSTPCFLDVTFIEDPLDAKFKEHNVSHSGVQSEKKMPEENDE